MATKRLTVFEAIWLTQPIHNHSHIHPRKYSSSLTMSPKEPPFKQLSG